MLCPGLPLLVLMLLGLSGGSPVKRQKHTAETGVHGHCKGDTGHSGRHVFAGHAGRRKRDRWENDPAPLTLGLQGKSLQIVKPFLNLS